MFKCTKMLIQSLQPSCDAQDAAICWQVDQMGQTSQQFYPVLPPGVKWIYPIFTLLFTPTHFTLPERGNTGVKRG